MSASTPTNPNRVVRVKDLNRFKTKLDEQGGDGGTVASATVINDLVNEII